MDKNRVEYMCKYCGTRRVRFINSSRPFPGVCPRRAKFGGKPLPHVWIISRSRF